MDTLVNEMSQIVASNEVGQIAASKALTFTIFGITFSYTLIYYIVMGGIFLLFILACFILLLPSGSCFCCPSCTSYRRCRIECDSDSPSTSPKIVRIVSEENIIPPESPRPDKVRLILVKE